MIYFLQDSLMNSKFRRIAFEIEILCNIMNILAATFDEFNMSLLNKSLNLFLKSHTDPKLLNSSV